MSLPTKDTFKQFLRGFVYPAECVYKKGHMGQIDYVTYEDDPNDVSGGITKYGIDLGSHKFLGRNGIKNLTIEQADEIYWDEFNKQGSSNMPEPLCYVYADCAINAGVGRAKQFLAKTKNPKEYIAEREAWYHRLVEARPSFNRYIKGWIARCENLRKYLNIT